MGYISLLESSSTLLAEQKVLLVSSLGFCWLHIPFCCTRSGTENDFASSDDIGLWENHHRQRRKRIERTYTGGPLPLSDPSPLFPYPFSPSYLFSSNHILSSFQGVCHGKGVIPKDSTFDHFIIYARSTITSSKTCKSHHGT